MSLVVRALGVWLLLLGAAILNGTFRQAVLVPMMGEPAGHVVSTLSLSAIIFGLGWLIAGWLDLVSSGEAWLVGGLWLGATIAFEFLGGHFLFGAPWSKLLADYNLAQGRVWIVVLMVTTLTPTIVFRMR